MESFAPSHPLRDRVVSIERVLSEGHRARILPTAGAVLGLQLSGRILSPEGPLSALGVTGIPDGARRYHYDGLTETYLVRFRPQGAACLGVPANLLRGRSLSLDELWAAPQRASATRLMDALLATSDRARRVALLEEFLVSLPFRRDLRLERALQRLGFAGRGDEKARVAVVAAELGLSERQLERLFLERVGISPKHYARLRRFEHAARLLRDGRSSGDVAFASGYADQAHLIREFRRFAGTTPGRLVRSDDFVA